MPPTLPNVLIALAALIPDRREAAHLRACATGARCFDLVDAEDLLASARNEARAADDAEDFDLRDIWQRIGSASSHVADSFEYSAADPEEALGLADELSTALRCLGVELRRAA